MTERGSTSDRSCDTCTHHSQANLDPRCRDCSMANLIYLPYWEAKEKPVEYPVTKDGGPCSSCRFDAHFYDQEPCNTCGKDGIYYWQHYSPIPVENNDGSTADYYVLPSGATQLQDLIASRDMNAQLGEIFRATYRYGQGHHSPRERDLKKIIFYAQAELDRLSKYPS